MKAAPCVICIPAYNEAVALPRLLAALSLQDAAGEGAGRLRVLVLANNCTDDTAALARACWHPRLDLRVEEIRLIGTQAHVGEARRQALAFGLEWLGAVGKPSGILISTDADASPPPGWVSANLRALAAGAECVGGQIRLDNSEALPPRLLAVRDRVARYWAAVRALSDCIDPMPWDPAPRHGDHVAASLAITASFYELVGGLPPLPCGEDNALVAAVERAGGRVRHAPDIWTAVSAREDGRATGGMAEEMTRWRQWGEGETTQLLPGAGFWRAVMQRRRDLRAAFAKADFGGFGGAATRLQALAAACPNGIAFVARAEPLMPPLPKEAQDIRPATAALEAIVALPGLAA